MKKKMILSGIMNRKKIYSKARVRRSLMKNDVAAIGIFLAFLVNILPLLFFFIAFMFVIANIMQIAIAILIAGVGIVLIRFALRGAGSAIKKLRKGHGEEYGPYYYGDY